MRVNNADKVTISGVQISSNNGATIWINESLNTRIENSTLQNSLMGIYIYNRVKPCSTSNTITGNQIKGVMIDNSTNITVSNSIITGNGDNSSTIMDDGGYTYKNLTRLTSATTR